MISNTDRLKDIRSYLDLEDPVREHSISSRYFKEEN